MSRFINTELKSDSDSDLDSSDLEEHQNYFEKSSHPKAVTRHIK